MNYQKMEEAYKNWREVHDLDELSLKEIYEIGYRHGVEDTQEGPE